MIDQPFYALPAVAVKLGDCSRATLYRLINQGKLVRVRMGGRALITGESLAGLIEELKPTHKPAHKSACDRMKRDVTA